MTNSKLAIHGAIAANVAIAATKRVVAGITGSSAMLSEGIHGRATHGLGRLSAAAGSREALFGHEESFATGGLPGVYSVAAPSRQKLLRSNCRSTRADDYSQAASGSRCRANSIASCSTRPTTTKPGSKR